MLKHIQGFLVTAIALRDGAYKHSHVNSEGVILSERDGEVPSPYPIEARGFPQNVERPNQVTAPPPAKLIERIIENIRARVALN